MSGAVGMYLRRTGTGKASHIAAQTISLHRCLAAAGAHLWLVWKTSSDMNPRKKSGTVDVRS